MRTANCQLSSAGPTRGEPYYVLAGLAVLIAAQLLAFHATSLFARNFWLDEIYTYTLVSDPDPGHALQALRGGVETNVPALHLLYRLLTPVLGGPGEISFRVLALLSVLGGLVAVYLTLRQVYAPVVCFTSVLAIWSHPLVLVHAFDARFYGPWFAAIAWLIYLLARLRFSTGLLLKLTAALCAAFICTVHYFGIISVVLVLCGEFYIRRRAAANRWNGLAATAVGTTILLACLPLLISQRAVSVVPTWIKPATPTSTVAFLYALFPTHLSILAAVALAARFFRKLGSDAKASVAVDQTPLAGMLALLGLPLVLIVMSVALQPVLVARYALPAVLGLTPAIAYLAAPFPRHWLGLACVVLALLSGRQLYHDAQEYASRDRGTEQLIHCLRSSTSEQDLIFENSHELYVVCRYAPDLVQRSYYLDFEKQQIADGSNRLWNRDLHRAFVKYYTSPGLKKLESLRQQATFCLVRHHPLAANPAYDQQAFPGFRAYALSESVYQFAAAKPIR